MKQIILAIFFLKLGLVQAQTSNSNTNQSDQKLYELKRELENSNHFLNPDKKKQDFIKLGDFFKDLELHSEAVKNYQAYLSINKTSDTSLVYVLNALASINLELKKFQIASDYSHKSLSISQNLKFIKGKANSHAILGSIAEKQNNYEKALQHEKISLSIFETLNDSTGLAITHENIGSIYEDLEEFNLAYNYFKKAQAYALNSSKDLQINIINNLGDTHRKRGKHAQAIIYSEKALHLAKEFKNESQIESALKDLARTYADLNNFEQAYNYLNNHSIVNEEELKQNNAKIVSALQVLYDVKENEAELELLAKQNQINTARQQIIIICTVVTFLVLITGFIYWKKRKQHENRILEYKQQLLQVDLDKKTVEEAALKREIEIKVSSLTNYSLHIAHKNKLLSDVSKTLSKLKDRNPNMVKSKIQDVISEINSDLTSNNEWTELMGYFAQIHPNFFQNLKTIASERFSASELRLCMLLRLNLSSKDIANILHITADSVRIARYRLRKKLPLDSKDDLQAYLLNL